MFIRTQQGVGLLEVMVSLMLLAVAVLGYAAMQLKASNVSLEADNQTRAVELARDLHERMRINKEGLKQFQSGSYTGGTARPCNTSDCTPEQLAVYDFEQVKTNATNLGMSVAIHKCAGTGSTGDSRHCIYVAWGDTTPTIGTNTTDCTNGTVYQPNAQCVFMESFSYVK